MSDMPLLIMMVGISGSGKTTLAKHISIEDGNIVVCRDEAVTNAPVIHSSDDLRGELFGDVNEQSRNAELFTELHRRIKHDLQSGKSVIYDATNINKKLRVSFLSELKHIHCKKVCVAVMTPYENCIRNNGMRDRRVPDRVIRKMYKSWQPPHFHEGFDQINFAFLLNDGEQPNRYSISELCDEMDAFDQENSHHTLTLGEHCRAAAKCCEELYPNDRTLHMAALLHDIGKLQTKTHTNCKGECDGECHYYQHHCVGAYMAMFYIQSGVFTVEDQCDIANMIYFHMHPYGAWKQSEKALKRDRSLIGDAMFNRVMELHRADVAAH